MRVATGTWTKWNPMAKMTTEFLRVLYCQEPELKVNDCLRLEITAELPNITCQERSWVSSQEKY